MFPGPHAQIFTNEAGEPLGWDYPSDEEYVDDDAFFGADDTEDDDTEIVQTTLIFKSEDGGTHTVKASMELGAMYFLQSIQGVVLTIADLA